MLNYKIHAYARSDIKEVIQYYKQERPELSFDFLRELQSTIYLLRTHPKIGAVREKNIRKFSLDRFSYDIFYSIENDRILIAGVLHQRRNPDLITLRLKDLPK